MKICIDRQEVGLFIRWLTGSNTPTSSGGSKDTVSPWITCLISVGVKTPTETASFIVILDCQGLNNQVQAR